MKMNKEYKIQYNEAKDSYRIMFLNSDHEWEQYSEEYNGVLYPRTYSSFYITIRIREKLLESNTRPIDNWRDCFLGE